MAESEKSSNAAPGNSLGLQAFNMTGREETTTKILKPQVDPQIKQRNLILSVVAVIGVVVALYMAFANSGLKWDELMKEREGSIGTAPAAAERQRSFENE